MRSLKSIQNEIYQLEKDIEYLKGLGASPSVSDESWDEIKKEIKRKMKILNHYYDKEDEILHVNRLK